jgi:predicted nucleic acid-binding protein
MERRLDTGETLVVAAPALIETYAVLTRLPPPHRLSPKHAETLLKVNFMGETVDMVALSADGYRRLLQTAADRGIAGGLLYDAVIHACCIAAEAETLLTFNERQFRHLAVDGIEIVVPV